MMTAAEVDSRKIQGTQYDRKRVVGDSILTEMKALHGAGVSAKRIAELEHLNRSTVMYNVSEDYRAAAIEHSKKTSKAHKQSMDYQDRVEYKRDLIAKGKI